MFWLKCFFDENFFLWKNCFEQNPIGFILDSYIDPAFPIFIYRICNGILYMICIGFI
jgi:hypothetical protein